MPFADEIAKRCEELLNLSNEGNLTEQSGWSPDEAFKIVQDQKWRLGSGISFARANFGSGTILDPENHAEKVKLDFLRALGFDVSETEATTAG